MDATETTEIVLPWRTAPFTATATSRRRGPVPPNSKDCWHGRPKGPNLSQMSPSNGTAPHAAAADEAALPTLPVEDLMVQLVQRASDIIATQKRLRGLLAANRSIVGQLSLPVVLQRIVEAARETAGARYAALGVLAPDGTLESLVHSGMDEDVVARIHDFPEGKGVLGALVGHPTPIRVANISQDPRSFGFPEGHPRMSTFLGVPIHAHGSVYGNLYLTEPTHGPEFTAEDEDLVAALAATAGIAVENARLYEESRRRQEWLLASSEISQRLLASNDDELEVWRLIAANVKHLADASLVCLVVPSEDEPSMLRVMVAAGANEHELEGSSYPREGSVAWRAMQDGRGVVVESGQEHGLGYLLEPEGYIGPAMALPMKGEWGSRGAIVICRRTNQPPFSMADVNMAEDFAGQAAIALELADARSAQQRLGALEDRERIARDLHDHVIQRLFATGLSLQSTAGTIPNPVVRGRLIRTVQELDETIRQIRTSIFALKYVKPTTSSVRATVLSVIEEVSPTLGFRPATSFAGPLDSLADDDLVSDIGAVLRESLTNVARHAQANSASVSVTTDGERLTVVVADNGRGMQGSSRRSGLANLRERAERYGGELHVENPSGEGLRLTWSIPLT